MLRSFIASIPVSKSNSFTFIIIISSTSLIVDGRVVKKKKRKEKEREIERERKRKKDMSKAIDIKCILLGASSVGKTSLTARFCFDTFDNSTVSTIGAAFALKEYKGLNVGLWDTAGQEKFDSISSFYCRGATVALLCFDLSDPQSFQNLPKYAAKLGEADDGCQVLLVGTKYDLVVDGTGKENGRRQVSEDQARQYAQAINARGYFETSSKTNYKVDDAFHFIFDERIRLIGSGLRTNNNNNNNIAITDESSNSLKKQSSCC